MHIRVKNCILFLSLLILFQSCGTEHSGFKVPNQNDKQMSNNSAAKLKGSRKDHDTSDSIQIISNLLQEEKINSTSAKSNHRFLETQLTIIHNTASFLIRNGQTAKARYLLNRIDFESMNSDTYRLLSMLCASEGDFDLAIDYINQSLNREPTNMDLLKHKGEIYLQIGDTASALSYFKRSVQKRNQDEKSLAYIAEILLLRGDIDQSLQYFGKIDSTSRIDLFGEAYGLALIKAGSTSRGEEILVQLIENGHIKAGETLIKSYDEHSADAIYRVSNKVLEVDSLNLTALLAKASYFDKKGFFSSCIPYYEKVLSIDSLNEDAKRGLAEVYGKIAYLRKIRAQRESLQLLEVPSLDASQILNQ